MRKQDDKPISPTTVEPESTSPIVSFSMRCEPSNFSLPYSTPVQHYASGYAPQVAESLYYGESVVPTQRWVAIPPHQAMLLNQSCTVAKVLFHPICSVESN